MSDASARLGFVLLVALVGCLSAGPAADGGRTSSPTPTPTPADVFVTTSPTPTSDTPACEEVEIMPDITVAESVSGPVTVTVLRIGDGSNETVFEHTYEGGGGETTRIFEGVERPIPDGVRFVAVARAEAGSAGGGTVTGTADRSRARADVTAVASSPQNYGIRIVAGSRGLSVHHWHYDPPRHYNWDCY